MYCSARKSYQQMLDPIHYEGLRLALESLRTTSVASLVVEGNEQSLYSRREKLSLQYAIIVYVEWASRVNFVTIFGDLYQNELWVI